jgi:hypothetical protein
LGAAEEERPPAERAGFGAAFADLATKRFADFAFTEPAAGRFADLATGRVADLATGRLAGLAAGAAGFGRRPAGRAALEAEAFVRFAEAARPTGFLVEALALRVAWLVRFAEPAPEWVFLLRFFGASLPAAFDLAMMESFRNLDSFAISVVLSDAYRKSGSPRRKAPRLFMKAPADRICGPPVPATKRR